MTFSLWRAGWLAAAVLATTSCGSSSPAAATTIPTPTPTVTTETFTGAVDVGGSDMHPFTVTLSGGQLSVTLTAAGPPATIFMGVGVGSPSTDGTTCTIFPGGSTATPAGTTAQIVGTAGAGSYCVVVYDVGNQTAQVTYSVTVNHY